MTRKQKGITVFISIVCAVVIAITVGIVLIVKEVKRNPLLGTWNEAAGVGSYHFYEDGKVEVTYENEAIPVLNLNHSGKLDGTYAYDKKSGEMSVTVKIYSKEITSNYTFDIKKDTMTLTDTATNKSRTYNLYQPEE